MGLKIGEIVKNTSYTSGKVIIRNVTGDIEIEAVAKPKSSSSAILYSQKELNASDNVQRSDEANIMDVFSADEIEDLHMNTRSVIETSQLPLALKLALLQCFENVEWKTDDWRKYYDALVSALGMNSFNVTNKLTRVSTSNDKKAVSSGSEYVATLTTDSGIISRVSVKMGGIDITNSAFIPKL